MRLDVRAPELHHHTGGFKGQHGDIAARQASRRVHARSTGPQARGLFTRPSPRADKDKTQPTLLAEAGARRVPGLLRRWPRGGSGVQ